MDNTTALSILDAYAAALDCLPAMGRGDLGPHWKEWVSHLQHIEDAPPEILAAMRPLTEEEERLLWDAYHHTGALSYESTRLAASPFHALFEDSLPWLFAHGKMSWSRAATRWMTETPPVGPPTNDAYQEIPIREISKDERVRGFHVRLGVDIARACAASENTESATQRRLLREQLLATLAYAPHPSGWRGVIHSRVIWGWPELLSSPAYASARTRPFTEPLALGAGLSRRDLFFSLLNNTQSIQGTPGYAMALSDLSPPSTLDLDAWQQWIQAAGVSWMASNGEEPALPSGLWDNLTERLLRHDPSTLLTAGRILSRVLQSLTPPPAVCDLLSAWWDTHRDALRPQPALSSYGPAPRRLGEVLLDCPYLNETPDWSRRYTSPEMTLEQAENVLNSLTPQTWPAIEPAILQWALTFADNSRLGTALSILESRMDCHITQTSQWMEVYLAHYSACHSSSWVLGWLNEGRLPYTPLPQSLLARLLQAPDRQVREYAIRTMAHARSTQSPPALDSSPARPLLP